MGHCWKCIYCCHNVDELKTIYETLNQSKSKQWSKFTRSEFRSLQQNQAWDLVNLPDGKNVVGRKWVFKHKRDKARLVAQGHFQKIRY